MITDGNMKTGEVMRNLLFALALLGAGLPATAADKDNGYAVYMAISCETFRAERWDPKGVRYNQIQAWISGYITAFNGWEPDTHNILGNSNVADVESWIENYCVANPLSDLSNAMVELVQELRPKRHRTAIDPVR